jgi:hypothetical protein
MPHRAVGADDLERRDVRHGSLAGLLDRTNELIAVDMAAEGKRQTSERLLLAYLLTPA